jgi:site-specific recombinase XerD
MRALRELSDRVYWFEERKVWRFPYRDPATRARKFLNCSAARFRRAGIPLTSPDVVRKPTKTAEVLAEKLRVAFLASLNVATTVETFTASGPPTISDAIEAYFALYEQKSPSYRASLRAIFGEFLTAVGNKPIESVADLDFKTYEKGLARRGLANATQRSYIAQVGMLFHFAHKKGWIKQDPRLTYRPPKEELHDPNPMNDDDVKAFFDFVRTPVRYRPEGWDYAEWIGVGLLCLGLRPIELMHARWEDLDWDERFLYVRKSHPNKEPQALQNQPIPTAAWPQFLARRRAEGIIWPGAHGDQLTPDSLGTMRDTLSRAMDGFQWKRFRKSYATILTTSGVEGMTVSRLLRHSAGGKNTSIAAKHYIGRSDRYLRDVVDEAFAPYAAMVSADVGARATLRAVEAPANATSCLAAFTRNAGTRTPLGSRRTRSRRTPRASLGPLPSLSFRTPRSSPRADRASARRGAHPP